EARRRAAEREAARARRLIERNVASEQNLDEALADRDAAAAALEVAKADRLSAEIDLERTTVKAPLSGVIGRSLTTRGALVTDGQAEPLAVIRTLDPVLVDVTQSAAEIIAWRRGRMADRLADASPEVALILADGSVYEETGLVTAAERQVDETTGVVTLRLEFPNPDHLLLPGMYVQVELPQGVARDVVLAPQEGVSRDRRGRATALVVGEDDVVEARVLEVVEARDHDWVVSGGLEPGDRLIVEGLQKVRPGDEAAPEERAPKANGSGGVARAEPDAETN
ncbi:MAG: efflux RND transporter periplasmic adaptor subunit, partial [Alphaproteobacteria bacterium]